MRRDCGRGKRAIHRARAGSPASDGRQFQSDHGQLCDRSRERIGAASCLPLPGAPRRLTRVVRPGTRLLTTMMPRRRAACCSCGPPIEETRACQTIDAWHAPCVPPDETVDPHPVSARRRSVMTDRSPEGRGMRRSVIRLGFLCALLLFAGSSNAVGLGPIQGGALPGPLPLFPADNWWNVDISAAPVDPNSTNFINFIGVTRGLHPDFGSEVSPGSAQVYGMPYAVVDGTQPKVQVNIVSYPGESDGVGVNFYPIPTQAITQAHWIEGGDPGNVDRRASEDRHLLIVDRDNEYLYELYNVFYNMTTGRWEAGSGAFFDMN